MQSLPPDLETLATDYRTVVAAVEALLGDLQDAQTNWQPRGGRAWSLGQIVEHVALATRLYLDEMEPAVRAAVQDGRHPRREPLRLPAVGRWFVRQLEPGSRRRIPAPGKIQPPSAVDRRQALRGFVAAHERAAVLLAEAAAVDVNRIRFRNPFVPLVRFTLGTGFAVLSAHSRRHLAQMRNLRQAADFPAA
jgi:hypothetical protein